VQRLPVRIAVPATIASEQLLRPGMSVVVSVNTKATTLAEQGARRTAQANTTTPR
jgi:multidrug resistance efflux pump